MAQPLFPAWFNPHRRGPQAPKRKTFAVYPDGTEAEVIKKVSPTSGRGAVYQVKRPDGGNEQSSVLRDLKHFLAQDFPGTRFEVRAA